MRMIYLSYQWRVKYRGRFIKTILYCHEKGFSERNSKVAYSLVEMERERLDGYGWYTYEPQKVLNAYPGWKKKWD